MSDTIIVAVISLAGTLLGSLFGILTANKLSNYRIEQLEKKVSAHNQLIERTYKLEEGVDLLNAETNRINKRLSILEEGKK